MEVDGASAHAHAGNEENENEHEQQGGEQANGDSAAQIALLKEQLASAVEAKEAAEEELLEFSHHTEVSHIYAMNSAFSLHAMW